MQHGLVVGGLWHHQLLLLNDGLHTDHHQFRMQPAMQITDGGQRISITEQQQ